MVLTDSIDRLNEIAGFMTADSDFWVTGRFERLHLINLLFSQQRLSGLEEEINIHLRYKTFLLGGKPSPEPERSSEVVLEELQSAIKAYSEAISSLSTLKKCEAPALHIIKAMIQNISEHSMFYKQLNSSFGLRHAASRHISVASEPRTWFYRFIAKHERLTRVFLQGQREGNVSYTKFSGERVTKTEFGIVAICLCLVQLLPVLALTSVSSKAIRLTVIIILMVLVSLLNAVFANTVRATNFGAIAAYSAIIVVFIGQTGQN